MMASEGSVEDSALSAASTSGEGGAVMMMNNMSLNNNNNNNNTSMNGGGGGSNHGSYGTGGGLTMMNGSGIGGSGGGGSQHGSLNNSQGSFSTPATPAINSEGRFGRVVQLDFTIPLSGSSIGMVPLKKSLSELSQSKSRVQFADGSDWLNRFCFARGGGLPVVSVEPGQPAHNAGVRACDVIVCVNAKDVRERPAGKVCEMIRKSSGPSVSLSVLRCMILPYNPDTILEEADANTVTSKKNSSFSVTVRVQRTNTFGFTPLKFSFSDCDSLPRAQKFIAKEMKQRCPFAAATGGLPVQSVDAEGPAATSGLESWDVITSVNGRDVRALSAAEIVPMIRDSPGGLVTLEVQRSLVPIDPPESPSGFSKMMDGFKSSFTRSRSKSTPDTPDSVQRDSQEVYRWCGGGYDPGMAPECVSGPPVAMATLPTDENSAAAAMMAGQLLLEQHHQQQQQPQQQQQQEQYYSSGGGAGMNGYQYLPQHQQQQYSQQQQQQQQYQSPHQPQYPQDQNGYTRY